MREDAGEDGEEGIALDVAVGAEAGLDTVEVGIVVAGVAAELEDSFGGKRCEDGGEGGGVEIAGGGDADGPAGGVDVGVANLREAEEGGEAAVEDRDLQAAEGASVSEGADPGGLEWVADGADGAALGEVQERTGDGREEMSVFVGVEVGDVDSGTLESLDLGEGLALDVVLGDAAAEERLNEVGEAGTEGLAVGAEEGWDALGMGGGDAVDEGDVAADAEGGKGARDGGSVLECRAGGHEGGGGEDAGAMELRDRTIDAWSQAEVVRVEDEAGGHGRLVGG